MLELARPASKPRLGARARVLVEGRAPRDQALGGSPVCLHRLRRGLSSRARRDAKGAALLLKIVCGESRRAADPASSHLRAVPEGDPRAQSLEVQGPATQVLLPCLCWTRTGRTAEVPWGTDQGTDHPVFLAQVAPWLWALRPGVRGDWRATAVLLGTMQVLCKGGTHGGQPPSAGKAAWRGLRADPSS